MPLTNREKQARHRARRRGITPEQSDIDKVDAKYGRLPPHASVAQQADRYRLYQAQAVIRLWQNGELPPDQMREMGALHQSQKREGAPETAPAKPKQRTSKAGPIPRPPGRTPG